MAGNNMGCAALAIELVPTPLIQIIIIVIENRVKIVGKLILLEEVFEGIIRWKCMNLSMGWYYFW